MTDYKTKYGTIHAGGPCKDDYANIETYEQANIRRHNPPTVKLQAPAIRALKDAERAYARRTRPWRKRRTIPTSGSWRSCEFQAQKYKEDPNRFAHPDKTLHTRGLAIDVDTRYLNGTIRKVLLAHGWHQSRPGDEPWHFSFHLTG